MSKRDKIICCADGISTYEGGAEKTIKVLMNSLAKHFDVQFVDSERVTVEFVSRNRTKFWVFGNYYNLIENRLIESFVENKINYAVVEFDYKFLPCRNLELFKLATGQDFAYDEWSRLVDEFLSAAKLVFFMSQKQLKKHIDNLKELKKEKCVAINSCFENEFYDLIEELCGTKKDIIVGIYGQNTPQKGVENAIDYCHKNLIYNYIDIYGENDYNSFLRNLSRCENLVFLPNGGDSCPRLVIEAKLLDVNVICNQNVEHIGDEWWSFEREKMIKHLKSTPNLFRDKIVDLLAS